MTYREELGADPVRFDLFAVLREHERSAATKPRIGLSRTLAEEIVALTQPPFLEFAASNVVGYQQRPNRAPKLSARFLGFFGPQGPLPLNTTIEACTWSNARDTSYADFTNLFASRFLQLFFRAWADARPIVQHDRPADDRFIAYVGALAGIGTDAYRNRDTVEDIAKAAYSGLTGSRIKSATRLKRLIRGIFKVETDVEERIASWLGFEPGDRMALGESASGLGLDAFIGARALSINDKLRIKIEARDLEQYRKFLPSGDLSDKLTDLVFFYLGHRFEFDVELSLPARCAAPARLGVSGELGWTAWMTPRVEGDGEARLRDARFDPMERRRNAPPARKPAPRPAGRKAASKTVVHGAIRGAN